MSTSLLISTFAPFPNTLYLSVPSNTLLNELPDLISGRFPEIPVSSLGFSVPNRHLSFDEQPLSSLHANDYSESPLVTLRLTPRVRGGKGGFGSQLRAAGGRMSSQKTSNNDSCRDLNGRRISTVKEARKLAEYLESEPQRKKATADAQKAKLEALERQLGIDPSDPSSSSEPAKLAGTKHRFDDAEYLEQSRDIVDGVKSAVAAGLLKKRKKAKKNAQVEGGKKEELVSKRETSDVGDQSVGALVGSEATLESSSVTLTASVAPEVAASA